MSLAVTAWNINPNRVWFVRLADAGSNILVKLYLTQSDAQADTNHQASGSSTGFGSNLPVTLTNATGATVPVSLFQDTYSWHLQVAGADGDPTIIFKIKEFVDLDDIDHPVYRNTTLIPLRAGAEIDAHTHAKFNRSITLGGSMPAITEGAIVIITSSRHGISELGQVMSHRITGDPNHLAGTIEVATFKALKR